MAVRPYRDKIVRRDFFAQGFRVGITFGVVGALIVLSRNKG